MLLYRSKLLVEPRFKAHTDELASNPEHIQFIAVK